MGILGKIFGRRRQGNSNNENKGNGNDNYKEKAGQIINTVAGGFDTGEISSKEFAKRTLEEAQDLVTKNSDANTIAELSPEEKNEIIKLYRALAEIIITSEGIPTEAAGDFLKQLIDGTPDVGVPVAVAEKKSLKNLPDDSLAELIGTAEKKDTKAAQQLAKGIDNENKKRDTQQRLNLRIIKNLYTRCDTLSFKDFISEINKIKTDAAEADAINENFDICFRKTVAKRVAYGFYNQSQVLIKNTICKVMSSTEMLEIDLPELVEEEYKIIINNEQYKRDKDKTEKFRYDKKLFRETIIKQIAEEVAQQYGDGGYVIPSLNLNDEERELFMKTLELKSKSPSERDLEAAQNQLNGLGNVEEVGKLIGELGSINNLESRKNIAEYLIQQFRIIQSCPEDQQKGLMDTMIQVDESVAKQYRSRAQRAEEQNKGQNKGQNTKTVANTKEQGQGGIEPED